MIVKLQYTLQCTYKFLLATCEYQYEIVLLMVYVCKQYMVVLKDFALM